MRFFLTLTLLIGSLTAMAEEVSRQQASDMIDEMVRMNTISAEEAAKAKVRLVNMNEAEWKKVNVEANEQAARMPASVSEEAPTNAEINEEQFHAIKSDLAVIAPHYQP